MHYTYTIFISRDAALTYAVCFGFAAMFCSKYILSRLKDFFDWKLRWGTRSKIISLKACEKDIVNMIRISNCNPIMLRLAWSDAGDI
jgi:hypothetical protein